MNKFLESFLTKIVLLILAGSFHFSAFSWEASEENCTPQKINDVVTKAYPSWKTCTQSSVSTTAGSPSTINNCNSAAIRMYDSFEKRCDNWREDNRREEDQRREEERREREDEKEDEKEDERREREEEREEDEKEDELEKFAKEQADKLEKERDKALEAQQEMIESAKNECKSSHQDVVTQRDRIESQVQKKQQQLDDIEDAITKHYASISKAEDQVREEILKLKQEERQAMNAFKQEEIKAEQAERGGERALEQSIEDIENAIFESDSALENMADFKEQICSNRSMEYLKISVECYNEQLKQVSEERATLYERIRSGRYEASSLAGLFQMDSQNIDQTFNRRLNALHAHCFESKTGENLPHPGQSLTVHIPCELEAFERRAKMCRENNNDRKICPMKPEVQVIEQQALAQLRKMKQDEVKVERARETALKNIEKLREDNRESKKWIERALADLEKQLQLAQQDFEERHERAENELKRVRESAENSILQLERNKIRLLASDPARHFEETLLVARVSCCNSNSIDPQQTAQQCALLNRYEQDPTRFQFAFVRPLPALRSTSGPSSRRTSSSGTSRSSSGSSGGVQ